MADTKIAYQEIRINVRDPQITHVHVYIENLSKDGMPFVEGWHYKAFPARIPSIEIIQLIGSEEDNPLLWPIRSPD